MSHKLLAAFGQLQHPDILVLGDLMLDRYVWAEPERVSPEAPVLVLRAGGRETRLGGAANVANMLRALEVAVTLVAVVGQDELGIYAHDLLTDAGVDCENVFKDPHRMTTTKDRIMGQAANRSAQQLLRIDYESRSALPPTLEDQVIQAVSRSIAHCDLILISDYGKGVCTPRVVKATISAANTAGIPVIVDPCRDSDFCSYVSATGITPNRSEAQSATGIDLDLSISACQAAHYLCHQLSLQWSAITLDRDGIVVALVDGTEAAITADVRSVCDVTGAGDMVLAVLGLGIASGLSPEESAALANWAAGIEVERLGAATISRDDMRARLMRDRPDRVVDVDGLAIALEARRSQGESIVLTNGCFDLLHIGHIKYLQEAAQLGDILVVAINSDTSVRQLKGLRRPIINEMDRAVMLAALSCVDYVVVFDELTPHTLVNRLRPDVLVKGGTYTADEVVGHELVTAYGGRVCVTGRVEGLSTSRLIENVMKASSSGDHA